MNRFEGRCALVTGAAQGIGLAVVTRLSAEGASVAALDINTEALYASVAELAATGHQVTAIQCDVRDEDAVAGAIETALGTLEHLDIVVNNAGVARDSPAEKMTTADWDLVLEIDLRGYFFVTRAALPSLRRAGTLGRIVNIGSRAYLGNPGQANYSAAKAGVIGLTRSLSLELGRDGITANVVAPGMIDTAFVRDHPHVDAFLDRAVAATPLRRLGLASEVAAAVAFLASSDASYITGEVLHVTGGRYG